MKTSWEKYLHTYRDGRLPLPEETEILGLFEEAQITGDYVAACCPWCHTLEQERTRTFENSMGLYYRCHACDQMYETPEVRNLLDELLVAGDGTDTDFAAAFPEVEYPFPRTMWTDPQPHVQAAVVAIRALAREVVELRVQSGQEVRP